MAVRDLSKPLNPAELKIDLLCRGIRIDKKTARSLEDVSPMVHAHPATGNGFEMVIPAKRRSLWVHAPLLEGAAEPAPYRLVQDGRTYCLVDDAAEALSYEVSIPTRPIWYDQLTASGIPMHSVALLQGTCLSVDVGDRCQFWSPVHPLNCKFCIAGRLPEQQEKTVEDVVETALAAREQSGISLLHFNAGYQGEGGLRKVFPYVEAVKRKSGLLVGIQFAPEKDLSLYEEVRKLGADHISFCFEFYNRDYFQRYVPGKAEVLGQGAFFEAIEYCARRMGKGAVSGQVIAGVEPVEDTLRAIDYLASIGAVPLVCVFRPMPGTEMEKNPAPRFDDMVRVFRHVYETCRTHHLPVGIAPNIHMSYSLGPEDTFHLSSNTAADRLYKRWIEALRHIMRPYFARRMKPKE